MDLIRREKNVFDWLDQIRLRPTMFVANGCVRELHTLVFGYYSGLAVHGVTEPVPQMDGHFSDWLYYRNKWSMSRGWGWAIAQHYPEPDKALAEFFRLVDEYRKLRPIRLWTVPLGKEHNPTGKRVKYGFDRLMEKPRRVDIFQYFPEPLHFLRFHYAQGIVDDDLLRDNLEYASTVALAKRWVRAELQVKHSEWRAVRRHVRADRSP